MRWFLSLTTPGFCFECNCLYPQGDLVLRSLSRTNPASPAVLCVEYQQKSLLFDSRGGLPIAKSSFPGLPIFLPRCEISPTLETRVYVSIVAGGSVTISILTQYLAVKPSWKDGVETQFFDDFGRRCQLGDSSGNFPLQHSRRTLQRRRHEKSREIDRLRFWSLGGRSQLFPVSQHC